MKVNGMLDSIEMLRAIERKVEDTGAEYFDVIVEYCERNGIEIETAAAIIKKSEPLKSKLQVEAEDMNLLPKTRRLPI